MYSQFNEQFAAATREFADAAAQVNRLAIESTESIFALQLAAIQDRANATFAFLGEAAEVRDADGIKNIWPKGVQVARENLERGVAVSQKMMEHSSKTNEQIADITKSQLASAAQTAQSSAEQVANAVNEKSQSFAKGAGKASKAK
ncbi:phasin family protein [Lysobacter ciconiae]|uniref:Phasin family protein n=1 Tax=Novilysobacter ciconiae TaxID=2781022 RepID=A0A7S6ZS18_9GAMM|nr:phasin family protein [Lysobacter ciconiae]QOW19219.1 phasin family protein [Lysobacter ciconiae]